MTDKQLNLYGKITLDELMILLNKEERSQFKRYYGEKIMESYEVEA